MGGPGPLRTAHSGSGGSPVLLRRQWRGGKQQNAELKSQELTSIDSSSMQEPGESRKSPGASQSDLRDYCHMI